ncbi:MAG: hypothetical protein F6K58_05935 [Symploca sp. SIO2E9]|nr:hypothetical protein [Symploca sp. SIO2E9]
MIITKERLRQAHHSFNLALVTTTACVLISFSGVGLVLLGKASEGTMTATGGLASTAYCLKLSKDANDRLDEVWQRLLSCTKY